MVVADTTGGPVVVERGAVVAAFTRLEGPCHDRAATARYGCQGPRRHQPGAVLPHRRRGRASIVQGHSNKYHDGFLGHAYVGEWVNLGAGTHNSDLRNDYGDVSVTVTVTAARATGRGKVGCFLGDHTKTGLGMLLNTGTSAGAFCNLLPSGGLLPKYVPSFGGLRNGVLVENADLSALLLTAQGDEPARGRVDGGSRRVVSSTAVADSGGTPAGTARARRRLRRSA